MQKLVNYYEKKAPSGDFSEIYDRDVVLISVRNIIITPKGSRMFLPDFGTSIYYYLFDQLDDQTLALIEAEVTEQLTKWEDRINLYSVKAYSAIEEQAIYLEIIFSYKNETISLPLKVDKSAYYEDVNTEFTLPFFKPKRIS